MLAFFGGQMDRRIWLGPKNPSGLPIPTPLLWNNPPTQPSSWTIEVLPGQELGQPGAEAWRMQKPRQVRSMHTARGTGWAMQVPFLSQHPSVPPAPTVGNQRQGMKKVLWTFLPPTYKRMSVPVCGQVGKEEGRVVSLHTNLQSTRYFSQNLKPPVFQEAASKFRGISIESESSAKDRKRNNQ